MSRPIFSTLASELKTPVFDILYSHPTQKPCSNHILTVADYSRRAESPNQTSTLLSIDPYIQKDTIDYLLHKSDIFLIRGGVAACLENARYNLYLHTLPRAPREINIFNNLTEFWIIAGKFDFAGLNNVAHSLTKLRQIHIEHDLTNIAIFNYEGVPIVDYCNTSTRQHVPNHPQAVALIYESKHLLAATYQLDSMANLPEILRDLRLFLTKSDHRPIPDVQVLVTVRCPMQLCRTCAIGGSGPYFIKFEKKMTIQYDFDTKGYRIIGYVPMK